MKVREKDKKSWLPPTFFYPLFVKEFPDLFHGKPEIPFFVHSLYSVLDFVSRIVVRRWKKQKMKMKRPEKKLNKSKCIERSPLSCFLGLDKDIPRISSRFSIYREWRREKSPFFIMKAKLISITAVSTLTIIGKKAILESVGGVKMSEGNPRVVVDVAGNGWISAVFKGRHFGFRIGDVFSSSE